MIPIDIVMVKFREIWLTGIGEIVRYLVDRRKNNKILTASKTRYCTDRAQNLPRPAPSNVLKSDSDFIPIGSLSAEL